MTVEHLQKLLNDVYELKKFYDKKENFNIFKILDLSGKENVHSDIIATLLNPKGSHNKGVLFLKLFLKECLNITEKEFDVNNIVVKREEILDNGRIDILIKNSKNQKIFIENKIYAGDQDKQILRYKEHNPYKMVYLTLYGHDASKNSKGDLEKEKDYILISYKNHIKQWLEKCEKESKNYSLLNAILQQYIILVKDLTNQSRSKEMAKELTKKILENDKNLSSAFEIAKVIPDLKEEIIKILIEIINNDEISKQNNLKFKKYGSGGKAYCGFSSKIKETDISIAFEFESNNYNAMVYGIIEPKKDEKLKQHLDKYKNKKYKNSQWPLVKDMDNNYISWNDNIFIDILSRNDSETVKIIIEKIKEILKHIEDYK